jgi:hypothetical protein
VGLDRGRPDRGVPTEDLGARHQLERHGRRALGGNRPYHRETQAGRRLFDRLLVRITEKLKLGAGFSTDFSPENTPSDFGDSKINFYNLTFGVDFANREKPPERGEDGFYLAFAVAFKYSLFPNDFPNPATQQLVDITINEFGINLAVKAAF